MSRGDEKAEARSRSREVEQIIVECPRGSGGLGREMAAYIVSCSSCLPNPAHPGGSVW
jgi:hypothetical protein